MAKFTKSITLLYNLKSETFDLNSDGGIDLQTGINMMLTGIKTITESILANVPPSHQQSMKENIYDSLNAAFNGVLESIIPTDDIPDLTSEAILEAQNKIIHDAAQAGMQLEDYLLKLRNDRQISLLNCGPNDPIGQKC
jgi:hypothetical protein